MGKANSCFRELLGLLLYLLYRLTRKLPSISSIYFHDPSPEILDTILRWYHKHHYRIISLQELIGYIESQNEPQGRVAFISFDDGKRSNLDLISICEKYNAPITVFIATEPLESGNYWWEYAIHKIGREQMYSLKNLSEKDFYEELSKIKEGVSLERSSMTINELKEFAMHPLVTIQSHTVNHPILTSCTNETLKKELIDSKLALEELIREPIEVFSYPNGNVGQREINALKEAGYRYAFTTKAEVFTLNNNPFLLPRMAMNNCGGKFDNLAKLTGIWYKFLNIFQKK